MQKVILIIVSIGLLSQFFGGCVNDTYSEYEIKLYDSWSRQITDDVGFTFSAELKLSKESYNFMVLTGGTTHTDLYGEISIKGNNMFVESDQNCLILGEKAKYEFSLSPSKLFLIAIEDSCSTRVKAIQGVWKRMKVE